jgi:hypothetical protein
VVNFHPLTLMGPKNLIEGDNSSDPRKVLVCSASSIEEEQCKKIDFCEWSGSSVIANGTETYASCSPLNIYPSVTEQRDLDLHRIHNLKTNLN